MKLTKDTLIEGEIIKEGTEVTIIVEKNIKESFFEDYEDLIRDVAVISNQYNEVSTEFHEGLQRIINKASSEGRSDIVAKATEIYKLIPNPFTLAIRTMDLEKLFKN